MCDWACDAGARGSAGAAAVPALHAGEPGHDGGVPGRLPGSLPGSLHSQQQPAHRDAGPAGQQPVPHDAALPSLPGVWGRAHSPLGRPIPVTRASHTGRLLVPLAPCLS